MPLTGSSMVHLSVPIHRTPGTVVLSLLLHQEASSVLLYTLLLEFHLKINLYFGPEPLQETNEISAL